MDFCSLDPEEFGKLLCKSFPLLFVNGYGKPLQTFYTECSSGWNELIYNLCEKLSFLAPLNDDEYCESIIPNRILQIKEKFGSLTLYISSESKEMRDVIRAFEKDSYSIC